MVKASIVVFLYSLGFFAYTGFFHEPLDYKLDQQEARELAAYLNEIRMRPSSYANELGGFMKKIDPKPTLRWNDTLAKVAEAKALDMVERDYIGHVDPDGKGINVLIHQAGYSLPNYMIEKPENNFFESLSFGRESAEEVVNSLIVDEGVPDHGHRKHLLGLNDFYGRATDIGVGFVRTPDKYYSSYVVIIIAFRS